MTPSPHATCHTQNAWVRMLPASSLVTPCFAAPASNTFATLACRSFAEDLQRSVFAPRFRDHHQMPFKNPLRRWRRIELPPVDAPLLPGESRIIESAMRQVLLTKVTVAVPVNLGSSAPDIEWCLTATHVTTGLKGGWHSGVDVHTPDEEGCGGDTTRAVGADAHADFMNPMGSPFARDAVQHGKVLRSVSCFAAAILASIILPHSQYAARARTLHVSVPCCVWLMKKAHRSMQL